MKVALSQTTRRSDLGSRSVAEFVAEFVAQNLDLCLVRFGQKPVSVARQFVNGGIKP
jgi:hypothetical protein